MIAAVILAAGASRRMGRPKLTLPWREGGTIIGHVVDVYRSAGASPVVVVATEGDSAMAEALTDLEVTRVVNPHSSEGEMLSSVKAGLQALGETKAESVLLAPGDHPQISAATVGLLIDAWRERRARIIAPSFEGRRGHPILIGRTLWGAILSLVADKTMRDFLREREGEIGYVVVEDRGVLLDIDTPEDYARAFSEPEA